MATQDPTRSCAKDPASEDLRTERAVLAFLLDQHPTRVTADELPFALDAKDFAEKDAIARAVRELTAVGLLRPERELIGLPCTSSAWSGADGCRRKVRRQPGAHARRLAGLSQDELSVRASVHRTEISQLERGLRLARVDTIVKLCGSLEADPAELLAGISWEPGENRIGHFKKPKSSNPSDA